MEVSPIGWLDRRIRPHIDQPADGCILYLVGAIVRKKIPSLGCRLSRMEKPLKPKEGVMHVKVTIEIDGQKAGEFEKEIVGTAAEIEESSLDLGRRAGRIVLERGLA